MTHRGRGCLEVNESPNPFFQKTSADYGARPQDAIKWSVDGKPPPFHHSKHKVDGNFSFLYSRESDRIGSKVAKPPMKEVKLLTKTEFLKKKREEVEQEVEVVDEDDIQEETKEKPSAEDILRAYNHAPKYEDPRYTTSTSDYGKKAPSVATIVVDRLGRPQGFSNSFLNIKPMNTSLTTAITKSTVHASLDPQFA